MRIASRAKSTLGPTWVRKGPKNLKTIIGLHNGHKLPNTCSLPAAAQRLKDLLVAALSVARTTKKQLC